MVTFGQSSSAMDTREKKLDKLCLLKESKKHGLQLSNQYMAIPSVSLVLKYFSKAQWI